MLAYVMIQLKKCDEKDFFHELKKMDCVKDVNVLFGDWDIIVKVEFNEPEDLAAFMMGKVRARDDVKNTSTLIAAK